MKSVRRMKCSTRFVIIALLFCFSGCYKKNIHDTKEILNTAEHIKGRIISKNEAIFSEPLRMIYIKPFLIYYSLKDEMLIKVFDCNLGLEIAKFGQHGKGPQELMAIGNMYVSSSTNILTIYDVVKKAIYTVDNINSDFKNINIIKRIQVKETAIQAFTIDSTKSYIIHGVFPDGRFKICQGNAVIYNYKIFPEIGPSISDTIFMNLGYQNFSAINPNRKMLANIVYSSEIIEGFEYNEKELIRKWFHEWSIEPFYQNNIGSAVSVKHSDDSFGFKNLAVNDKFIYCVYSDVSIGKNRKLSASGLYLMVFNWEGKLKRVYKFDYPIRTIAVSEDGEKIWGTSIIEDDIKIIEYLLEQ